MLYTCHGVDLGSSIAYIRAMKQKRSVGRPRDGETVLQSTIPVRFTAEMLAEIDAIWDAEKSKGLSRSQILRLLIADGIEVWRKRK